MSLLCCVCEERVCQALLDPSGKNIIINLGKLAEWPRPLVQRLLQPQDDYSATQTDH